MIRELNGLTIKPWSDRLAMYVFQDLDINDQVEAALARGDDAEPLALFADWRAGNPWRATSVIVCDSHRNSPAVLPFAVLGLSHTGARGVLQAALVSRRHHAFQRPLARLVAFLRRDLPHYAAEHSITRIESRCWSGHPTAARLLEAIGFRAECDVPGFGDGSVVFRQFAWTIPQMEEI